MRHIGHLSSEALARRFSDFLLARAIHNEVEGESDGSWSVWIREEDSVPAAQNWLAQFRKDPEAAEFRKAEAEAVRVRSAEAGERAVYQRRLRTRRSLFPKSGAYGVGVLTYSLIVACVVVALYTRLGAYREAVRPLLISDPETARGGFLPEVFAGQIWRLFTPMLIHFGPVHLIFNLLWLYQLGSLIEGRQGPGCLAWVVAGTGLCSNLAQYYTGGPDFGGMSGVVYGLAGYVWIRGKLDPGSGLYLHPQNVFILAVWLMACIAGVIPHVANAAHVGGLIAGILWGWTSAWRALHRPE